MNSKSFTLTSRSVIGVIVLLLGVLLTLGNFDIIDAGSVVRFWPVLLIAFGAVKLIEPGSRAGRSFGGLIAVVGLVMVLNRMDVVDIDLWDFWPLLLVIAGASLIWHKRDADVGMREAEGGEVITGTAVLGGLEQRSMSQQFKGGSISAILGGHEVDLRDADMGDGDTAVLDIFVLIGGAELRIPDDWTVIMEGSAFIGGYENKARGSAAVSKRLVIRGTAVMGGVEIRN
ncbi:MAG: DUF5668 domain-containing protein [Bacteroidota bacterium]|nr:DUF5668 domain-containing protein [Bacteroidota bacterium]